MSNHTIPELSVDTQVLERLLLEVPVDGFIGYETLTKAIGRDVQTRARHILQSAVRRAQRDKSIVFSAVRGEGLKRLTDGAVLGVGAAAVASIGRKSRRAVRTLGCANFEALKPSERSQHNMLVSQLGVLAHITSGATQKKLEARAGHEKLAVAKMLEAVQESI